MELILSIAYISFFIFVINKMPFFEADGLNKKTLSLIFLLKFAAGLTLWYIYTYYYTNRATADIYKYFDAGNILFNTLYTQPIHFIKLMSGIDCYSAEFAPYYNQMNFWPHSAELSNFTMIRINALIRFFSMGYFNVHTVFFCFFSLIGLTAIYKAFYPTLKNKAKEFMVLLFLFPSVVFWGSGVLKEGILLFAMGLFILNFMQLPKAYAILLCFVTGYILVISKPFLLIAMLPALAFFIWAKNNTSAKVFLKYTVVMIMSLVIVLNIHTFTTLPNPLNSLVEKQQLFTQLASGVMVDSNNQPIDIPKSAIPINTLEPTLSSLIQNSPHAIFNALLRPFIWEADSLMMIPAAIENLFIVLLLLLCVFFIKPLQQIRWEYVLLCLSFAIIQLLIIGYTTPIIGAIVRYKITALPFLLIALLLIIDKEKLSKKVPFYSALFK